MVEEETGKDGDVDCTSDGDRGAGAVLGVKEGGKGRRGTFER